jgi:hypothetical protein
MLEMLVDHTTSPEWQRAVVLELWIRAIDMDEGDDRAWPSAPIEGRQ